MRQIKFPCYFTMSVGQQILFKLGRNEREKKRGKQSHFVPSLLVPPSVIKYYQFGILKMLSYTTSNMKIIMTRRGDKQNK